MQCGSDDSYIGKKRINCLVPAVGISTHRGKETFPGRPALWETEGAVGVCYAEKGGVRVFQVYC
jgi:hypothetical protein